MYSEDDDPLIHQRVLEQQNAIIREQALLPPLSMRFALAPSSDHCLLAGELQGNAVMGRKFVEGILPKYDSIRYARRDGSCFYRCALFGVMEQCLTSDDVCRLVTDLVATLQKKIVATFSDYADDFCEVVRLVLEDISNRRITSADDLLARLCNADEAEYFVFFCRYTVSCYLRDHVNEYQGIVEALGFPSMEAYCQAEVETIGRDSDHLHIMAFANAFHVAFVIQCLDASSGTMVHHELAPEAISSLSCVLRPVHLLFRPGHYDLIYPRC